jgi:hypothetical protein
MGGGSKQTAAPTQSTQYVLSPEQRELMDLAMPGIRQFAAKTPERYTGRTTAGFNPTQEAAQEMALTAAGDQAGAARGAGGAHAFWTGGAGGGGAADLFDPTTNPYMQRAIEGAIRPAEQALTRSALPAVRSGAGETGQYGSTRQGIAEGIAMGDFGRSALDTGAKITTDLTKAFADNQLRAMGLTGEIQDAFTRPAITTGTVGDVRQQQEQALLDEQLRNFQFDQYAPFLQSQEILQLMAGLPGGSTVSTGSVPPAPGKGQQALGGALAGAQMGSMFGPWGMGIGAAGGAALPFLFS